MRNLKKILALVLALVMSFSVMSVAGAAYADQDAVAENEYAAAVNALTAVGLFKGDANTNEFRPNEPVLRREAATVIYRLASKDFANEFDAFYGSAAIFKDATAEDWWSGAVNYCKLSGYINGKSADTFAPNDYVTGYEVLAMTLRVAGCDPKNEKFVGANWAPAVAIEATKLGLLDSVKGVNLNAPATRALVAQLVFATVTDDDLKDNFKLGLAQLVNEKDVDDWGRVTITNGWYLADGSYDGTETVTETALFTGEKVTVADVKAANEKLVGKSFDIYWNGEKLTEKFDTTDEKAVVGGKGLTVELYADRVVVIETELVKVIDVDAKKGEATLSVKDAEGKNLVIKGEYTKGQYLVTEYNKNLKAGNTGYRAVAAAQIVEKKVLSRVADGLYYIEGVKVAPAANFVKFVETLKNGTAYNWIYDEKGNLIGVDAYVAPKTETPEAEAPVYVVVLGVQKFTNSLSFGDTKPATEIKANVLYLGETEYKTVNLAGYYNGLNDKKEIQTVDFTAENSFAVTTSYTKGMHTDLYQVMGDKNGALILKKVDAKVDTTEYVEGKEYATYTKGTQMINGELVNNKTVFAFLDAEKGTASYVTGYTNVATFNAARVLYLVGETFVEYVFVPATVVEKVTKPDVYETTDAFYYLTEEAYVDWATLTLNGLVTMAGEKVTLNVEKTFAADVYNTLTEMVNLYAGTILKVTTTTKNGELYSTEIASAMATGSEYTVTLADGKTKTYTAKYMDKDAYQLVDGLLIIKAARAQQVLDLNNIKNIVDQDGNKVEIEELYNLKGNLYVVYSGDSVETIVVTKVTAKSLADKLDASVKTITADAILADVDEALLTYTIGGDVEAYKTTLINAIKNSTALNVVAMSGAVVDVKVEIDAEAKTGVAKVIVEGIKEAIEIALKVVDKK